MSDMLEDKELDSAKSKGQSVRVNVDKLEQMMNRVGELVIDQTRIRQLEADIRRQEGASDAIEELRHLAGRLTRVIGDLQNTVMRIRMIPLDQLFSRFPRMVRDLARASGKEVELIVEGGETELDRTLLEEIGDPFFRLIRHAIEKGIEIPEKRLAAGKPAKGALRIRAGYEDNQVVVIVEDDGAGLDPDRLKRMAVEQGLLAEEGAAGLGEHEALELIFHPGLTTASLSGDEAPGGSQGLDSVRAGIERINGKVQVDSRRGVGTKFSVRLPITLTIIQGLLVEVADRPYVVPMNQVSEIVRIQAESVVTVQGLPVITLRNKVVPLVWLHDYLGFARDSLRGRQMSVLVVGHAAERVAVVVDRLNGNQDVVVKTLGAFIGQPEGVAGATLLGNGKVAFILDLEDVVAQLGFYR
ncbi:chemotaxis protein CheA [Cohnella hongkongensis]|uniref:histidine kinase n=1 Tax=Cohnella hongkongensis TaxID=178337 RepID=A0ABV9FB77_9BACL